jgi:hypothetical protein
MNERGSLRRLLLAHAKTMRSTPTLKRSELSFGTYATRRARTPLTPRGYDAPAFFSPVLDQRRPEERVGCVAGAKRLGLIHQIGHIQLLSFYRLWYLSRIAYV